MTFQDIAQQACNLVGENDANSLQFAKDRVKDAYRVLWNSFQWPETLVLQQVVGPAGQSSIFTDSSFGEIYNSSWVPSGAGSQLALGTFPQGNATVAVANTGTMAVG